MRSRLVRARVRQRAARMLQTDEPDDFVLATGAFTVREFRAGRVRACRFGLAVVKFDQRYRRPQWIR